MKDLDKAKVPNDSTKTPKMGSDVLANLNLKGMLNGTWRPENTDQSFDVLQVALGETATVSDVDLVRIRERLSYTLEIVRKRLIVLDEMVRLLNDREFRANYDEKLQTELQLCIEVIRLICDDLDSHLKKVSELCDTRNINLQEPQLTPEPAPSIMSRIFSLRNLVAVAVPAAVLNLALSLQINRNNSAADANLDECVENIVGQVGAECVDLYSEESGQCIAPTVPDNTCLETWVQERRSFFNAED